MNEKQITGKIENPFDGKNFNLYGIKPEDVTEELIEAYRENGTRIGVFYNAELDRLDVYNINERDYIYTYDAGDVLHYDYVEEYEELPKYARLKYDYLYHYDTSFYMELIYNNKMEDYLREFSDRAIKYSDNLKKELEEKYPENDSLVKEMINEYMNEYIKNK